MRTKRGWGGGQKHVAGHCYAYWFVGPGVLKSLHRPTQLKHDREITLSFPPPPSPSHRASRSDLFRRLSSGQKQEVESSDKGLQEMRGELAVIKKNATKLESEVRDLRGELTVSREETVETKQEVMRLQEPRLPPHRVQNTPSTPAPTDEVMRKTQGRSTTSLGPSPVHACHKHAVPAALSLSAPPFLGMLTWRLHGDPTFISASPGGKRGGHADSSHGGQGLDGGPHRSGRAGRLRSIPDDGLAMTASQQGMPCFVARSLAASLS